MDKKLFKTREEIYKKCPSIFWEVSIFSLIIAIGLVALETVVPGLFILTISLIFFPVLYATFMTLYSIKFGGTVSVGSTVAISTTYFKRNNFGCFRVLRCFFHAILLYLIAYVVLYFALQPIFQSIYGNAFTESYNHLLELYNASDLEGAINYLNEDNPVSLFMDFARSLGGTCGVFGFIFGIAFNSTNVYLCANIPGASAQFSTAVFNRFLKSKSNSYRKDFWSLQWPLFVLLVVGLVGGYTLVIGVDMPFSYALPISTMLGIFLMIPYAPFFFAGMESLFAKYNGDLKQASMDLTNDFLARIKNNIRLSEEEKAKLEELLSKKQPDENGEINKEDAFDNQTNDVEFDDPIDNSNKSRRDDDDGTNE